MKKNALEAKKEKLQLSEHNHKLTEKLRWINKKEDITAPGIFEILEKEQAKEFYVERAEHTIVSSCSATTKISYFVKENVSTTEVGVNTDFPDDLLLDENAEITMLHKCSRDFLIDILE